MKPSIILTPTHFVIDVFRWICIFILVIGSLAAIAFQLEAILFRYPLDYGEAPLINQAVHMAAGNSIYRHDLDEAPFTIANYPPVYVILTAVFTMLFGPAFWYGRLISSLSMIASAVLISLMVYSRSKKWKLALIPGLLFMNIPYVVGWSTLARIDHLALFFALMGLYFLFRDQQTGRLLNRSFIWGCIFLVLAIFTRQSYALAAPLGGFLFLFKKSRKRGLLLFVIVGGSSLLLFLILNIMTGGGFFFNIVTANINPFGFDRMINNFRNFFESIPVIIFFALFGLILSFRQVDDWPMLMGFVVGGFFSALTIGKIGSNVNYFLELAAALCLLIGFGLFSLERSAKQLLSLGVTCLFLFFLSWQGLHLIRFVQNDTRYLLEDRQESKEALVTLESMVSQNLDRPILADEYMGMIVLSGESLYLQPFEITQVANASIWNQNILNKQIENEAFSLILLQERSWWEYVVQERWTPEMLDAIRKNYRLIAQLENTNVYQPKTIKRMDTTTTCPKGIWPLPTTAYLGFKYQEGMLTLYGAGAEGRVPITAPADGKVYRPAVFQEGSLLIVHEDSLNPGEKVITLYTDMRSYRGQETLIVDDFPVGASGILVEAGDVIGYQSMWSGTIMQQNWLHVNFGIASYQDQFLTDYDLLIENLISPVNYFGILIDFEVDKLRPIECLP